MFCAAHRCALRLCFRARACARACVRACVCACGGVAVRSVLGGSAVPAYVGVGGKCTCIACIITYLCSNCVHHTLYSMRFRASPPAAWQRQHL